VLFSGSAYTSAQAAAETLASKYDVGVELWSATSYKALREDALEVDRWNRLHPGEPPRTAAVTDILADAPGPEVGAVDADRELRRWPPSALATPLSSTSGAGSGFGVAQL